MAVNAQQFSTPRVTSNVLTKLSILDPTNAEGWVKKFPDLIRGNYWLSLMGLPDIMVRSGRRDFKTYVNENRPMPHITLETGATGAGPGEPVEVQVNVASHTGIDNSLSPLTVGDIWQVNETAIQVEILEVNKSVGGAHTVSLNPVRSTDTLELEEGSQLVWFGRISAEEASTEMPGLYGGWTEATGYTDIIRYDQEYSDVTMFTEILNDNGETFWELNRPDLDVKMAYQREQKHIFGEDMDNLKAHSNQAGRAKGIIQYAKEENGTIVPTGGNIIDDAFLQELAERALSDGDTNEYHMLAGPAYSFAFQDALNDYLNNSNIRIVINYDSFGSEGVAIDRNFSSYGAYGVTFHKPENFQYFNRRRTHGANNATSFYNDAALFIPQAIVNDLPDGTPRRKVSIRYHTQRDGDAYIKYFQDGAVLNPMASVEQVAKVGLISYEGLEVFGTSGLMFSKLA